jgi:hypothetical protein
VSKGRHTAKAARDLAPLKRERQYMHVLESALDAGKSLAAAERIAAATVNKFRAGQARKKKGAARLPHAPEEIQDAGGVDEPHEEPRSVSKGRFTRETPHRGRLATPDEIEQNIVQHVNHPQDYRWYFQKAFPLRKIGHLKNGTSPLDVSSAGWKRWLAGERRHALESDDQEPWGDDFVHWFRGGGNWDEECAVIVTEQPREKFGVQDGNHRVAVAHEEGMTTVPAFVGYLP